MLKWSSAGLNNFYPVRELRSSDTPTLAVLLFKLITVGYSSFSSAEPRAWTSFPLSLSLSLPLSLFEQALLLTLTPLLVSALLRLYLLAAHYGDNSSDSFSAPTSSVVGKLADSMPIAPRALRTLYKQLSRVHCTATKERF